MNTTVARLLMLSAKFRGLKIVTCPKCGNEALAVEDNIAHSVGNIFLRASGNTVKRALGGGTLGNIIGTGANELANKTMKHYMGICYYCDNQWEE